MIFGYTEEMLKKYGLGMGISDIGSVYFSFWFWFLRF